MLSGEYPAWLDDEYGLDGGGYTLRRLWRDVIDSHLTIDVFNKQLWVWQLQNAFGSRYCSPQQAADSAYRGGSLTNPWSSADDDRASCEPPPASDDATLSALTLSGVDFGTFGTSTLSYTAEVASGVTGTTVTRHHNRLRGKRGRQP